MKLTITLTKQQQAAAKRLAKLDQWEWNPDYMWPHPYDRTSREPRDDEHVLANAVLRALKKAGAK